MNSHVGGSASRHDRAALQGLALRLHRAGSVTAQQLVPPAVDSCSTAGTRWECRLPRKSEGEVDEG